MSYKAEILLIFLFLFFSSFFSATETAFSSLNRTKLHSLAEKGIKRAEKAAVLHEKYEKLLTTVLIGNNIVNIAMSSIATVMFVKLLGEVGATVSTVVITLLVLIFGEITPKCIAKKFPEKFAIAVTPVISFFVVFLTPLSFLFSLWNSLIALIVRDGENGRKLSQEELLLLVDEVENEGTLDNSESTLVKNAIEFSEIRAGDILTHRTNLVAIELNDSRDNIEKTFENAGYSRLPVYEESIDNIVGVLNIRDFFFNDGKCIGEIIDKPIFILETEKIDDVLALLQREKASLAIVLDEYGGTVGIVTVEDIIEELVGEIWDEHDEITEEIRQNPDGTYSSDGGASLDDLAEKLDCTFDTESVSVGGFVTEIMGHIPSVGESVVHMGYCFLVTEADGKKVLSVNIMRESNKENENIN